MQDLTHDNQQARELALGCWFLTGATATGKTTVSLELARRIHAEIILLDSMTIYRGMDIGTAKVSLADRSLVPHHLVDICDPVHSFSVSEYRGLALQKIREIRGRGREVLFVGGSALYLKTLLRGLFDGPPGNRDFRNEIERETDQVGNGELHKRLAVVDPLSAHKLHVNDRRRIIRALEVFRETGRPISHQQMEFDQATPPGQCRVFCLRRPRAELHQRIAERVSGMFRDGFVQEVAGLKERWGTMSKSASQAVGYNEILQFLDNEMTLEQTMERVLIRTRRFARHQETWFRGMQECRILDIAGEIAPAEVADQLLDLGLHQTEPAAR